MVYRLYVERKPGFALEADALRGELGLAAVERIRIYNRYDAENLPQALFEQARSTVFSDPCTDMCHSALPEADCTYERETLRRLSALTAACYAAAGKLEKDLLDAKAIEDVSKLGYYCHNVILPDMTELRTCADELETLSPSELWPYPSYGELLFGIS